MSSFLRVVASTNVALQGQGQGLLRLPRDPEGRLGEHMGACFRQEARAAGVPRVRDRGDARCASDARYADQSSTVFFSVVQAIMHPSQDSLLQ